MWSESAHSRETPRASRSSLATFGVNFGLLCAAIVWAQWPSFHRMRASWETLPQYSHGYLVPLFAAVILWARRSDLQDESPVPSWLGLPLIGIGLALKWAGISYYYDYLDDVSLIPLLMGAVTLAGGWRALYWSWPAILFLLFMIPLPFRLETAIQQTLLQFATNASTYLLQTLGFAAFAEGNVIQLPTTRLGVAEACSGLRMSIVCTAMAALCAVLSSAPWPHRAIIFFSGVPLAMTANIIRICVMGIGGETLGTERARELFHDAMGYLMMPIALVLLGLEFLVLNWIYDFEADDHHRRPLFETQPG